MLQARYTRARTILTAVLVLTIISGAIADFGFMHASNDGWPPHAKFHALWNVWHITGTHGLALAVFWLDMNLDKHVQIRLATLIHLALAVSFFISMATATVWGASVHPDIPVADRPPTLFGIDGNVLGFLLATPLVVWAWLSVERTRSNPG